MNAYLVLLALLGLAFLGSRGAQGVLGLRAGAEYLLLGVVLGPQLLAVMDRSTLRGFEPLLVCGVGWLTLGIGLDWGGGGRRPVPGAAWAWGIGGALLTALGVGAAVYAAAGALGLADGPRRWLLAAVAASILADTTRHTLRWLVERQGARGPLTDRLFAVADVDDLVPVLGLAGVLAWSASGAAGLPPLTLLGATLGLGLLLGGLLAGLVRDGPPPAETWGLLLGVTLLGTGVAARLELSAPTVGFLAGLTVRRLSQRAPELSSMLGRTQRSVMLPMLVLAGGLIDLRLGWGWAALLGVALAARVASKLALGAALAPSGRGVRWSTGLSLTPSGALAVMLALAFELVTPTRLGNWAVALAGASLVLGELLGVAGLRRALGATGELPGPPAATTPTAPAEAA